MEKAYVHYNSITCIKVLKLVYLGGSGFQACRSRVGHTQRRCLQIQKSTLNYWRNETIFKYLSNLSILQRISVPPPPPSSKILQKIRKNSYNIHKPSRVWGNQNLSFSIVKSSKKWWSYLKILTLRKIFRKKWKLLRIIWNVEKIEKIENLFFWFITDFRLKKINFRFFQFSRRFRWF